MRIVTGLFIGLIVLALAFGLTIYYARMARMLEERGLSRRNLIFGPWAWILILWTPKGDGAPKPRRGRVR